MLLILLVTCPIFSPLYDRLISQINPRITLGAKALISARGLELRILMLRTRRVYMMIQIQGALSRLLEEPRNLLN